MKRYAIGLCSFEEDIEVLIIEAENEIFAMHKAVANKYNWQMKEDEVSLIDSVDKAIDFYLQGDVNISRPVQV